MNTNKYLIALVACCAIGVSSAGAQKYSVTDLGFLPNKKEDVSTAAAINDSGQVAGTSGGSAFRFTKEIEEIGQDPDGLSRGFGIDGSGQVVGDTTFKGGPVSHAALFSNGTVRDLGALKGSGPFSRANGINASGQVVGFSGETFDSESARAFITDTSSASRPRLVDLGTLGGQYAQAWGINDSGSVTGNSQTKSATGMVTHAFLWQSGRGMLDLGTLAGDFSYGTFINANNHVVGYSTIDTENDRVHAFLHDGKQMLDLGSLGGAAYESDRSYALGVNGHDQVVGYSYLPANWGDIWNPPLQQVAFVYHKGLMVDLNDLIGDATKEYRLDSATAINDKGQIVAIAFVNSAGNYHAVLLTPMGTDASTDGLERESIKVTSATYSVTYGMLTVSATYSVRAEGTMPTVLSVYESANNQLIGTLGTKDGRSYFGSFKSNGNPQKIWVADNNGKRADAAVVEGK